MAAPLVSMIMGMVSAMAFGGVGFLDSQDQLWILRSAPSGVAKFIKARIAEGFLLALVFSLFPPVIVTILLGFGIIEMLSLFVSTYVFICGGMLIGTGVTANNPSYDDTKSKAFRNNIFATIGIYLGTYMAMIFVLAKVGQFTSGLLSIAFLTIPIFIAGLLTVYIGAKRMSRRL